MYLSRDLSAGAVATQVAKERAAEVALEVARGMGATVVEVALEVVRVRRWQRRRRHRCRQEANSMH